VFELVVVIHFGFIVWAVAGGFLVIKWWWLALLHLPALAWAVLLEWYGWLCPLTPLENALRAKRDMPMYDTGFIENYIFPVIYPETLTREIQIAMAVGLVLINLAAYGVVIHKHLSKR
jgi:hypothetical protein